LNKPKIDAETEKRWLIRIISILIAVVSFFVTDTWRNDRIDHKYFYISIISLRDSVSDNSKSIQNLSNYTDKNRLTDQKSSREITEQLKTELKLWSDARYQKRK